MNNMLGTSYKLIQRLTLQHRFEESQTLEKSFLQVRHFSSVRYVLEVGILLISRLQNLESHKNLPQQLSLQHNGPQ